MFSQYGLKTNHLIFSSQFHIFHSIALKPFYFHESIQIIFTRAELGSTQKALTYFTHANFSDCNSRIERTILNRSWSLPVPAQFFHLKFLKRWTQTTCY